MIIKHKTLVPKGSAKKLKAYYLSFAFQFN